MFIHRYLERTGARTRFHREVGERAIEFGIVAARRALANAGLRPDEIDLLIFVGVGRGFLEPASANVFQTALEMHNATCFDLIDACASWLRGIDVAHHMLRADVYRHVMILNCEFNFDEYHTKALEAHEELDDVVAGYTIGEAATATIVSRSSSDRDYCASFRNDGSKSDLCEIPLPSSDQFRMSPNPHRSPLRFVAKSQTLNVAAIRALRDQYAADPRFHSLTYDMTFGHATSLPTTRRVAKALGLDMAKHFEIFPRFGNTVSASIPLAMSVALEEGRLERGARVLLIAGSAGLTTAFCTFRF